MDFLLDLFVTFLLFTSCLVIYMKRSLKYWEKRKITSLEASIPFGNLENLLFSKKSQAIQYQAFYKKLKELGVRYGGVYSFMSPIFVPIDPEVTKHILTKDFRHFHERGFYYNEKDQPITAHLFMVGGGRWKNLRTKFSPAFSSGKIKSMFQLISNCTIPMVEMVAQYAVDKKPVNINETAACYTTDVIGTCAFGVDCNSFNDPNIKLFKLLRIAIDELDKLVKGGFCFSFPDFARFLKITQLPRDIEAYFIQIIADTVSHREENGIRKNDFLQILIDLKNEPNENASNLTMTEITAQCLLFFIAGFDTSSITIAFCLFELALQKDIQQKARDEIKSVLDKHGGQITFDSINEMTYLRQVVDETLRKYPPLPVLHRKCTEEYKIPGSDHVLESGTQIIIPIMGIHYDPEHYPDPETFDPDRFTEEKGTQRNSYTYLPFGEGPRHCIGLRLGLVITMTGLASLLRKFAFTLNPKTTTTINFSTVLTLHTVKDFILDVSVVDE